MFFQSRRQVFSLRSPSTNAIIWRVRRHTAIHSQRLFTFSGQRTTIICSFFIFAIARSQFQNRPFTIIFAPILLMTLTIMTIFNDVRAVAKTAFVSVVFCIRSLNLPHHFYFYHYPTFYSANISAKTLNTCFCADALHLPEPFHQPRLAHGADLVEHHLSVFALKATGRARGVVSLFGRHRRDDDCHNNDIRQRTIIPRTT